MQAEVQQKHREKSKVKKEIRSIDISLRTSFNVIFYNCIIHQINIATKSKFKVLSKRHLKKLYQFRKRKAVMGNETKLSTYIKHTVHSFSSYALSDESIKNFLMVQITIYRPLLAIMLSKLNLNCFIKTFYQIFRTSLKTNERS